MLQTANLEGVLEKNMSKPRIFAVKVRRRCALSGEIHINSHLYFVHTDEPDAA